jgi:hypothetical protein
MGSSALVDTRKAGIRPERKSTLSNFYSYPKGLEEDPGSKGRCQPESLRRPFPDRSPMQDRGPGPRRPDRQGGTGLTRGRGRRTSTVPPAGRPAPAPRRLAGSRAFHAQRAPEVPAVAPRKPRRPRLFRPRRPLRAKTESLPDAAGNPPVTGEGFSEAPRREAA